MESEMLLNATQKQVGYGVECDDAADERGKRCAMTWMVEVDYYSHVVSGLDTQLTGNYVNFNTI